jgi:MFS transporter, DHA1 family, multidrug resistance protein
MTTDPRRLSQPEFIALIAMLFATIAFSIDAMLPALPQIAAELTPADPNRAQLILTSFVLGMGLGTFVAGPISDALGRKPVIVLGAGLYMVGALLAWAAPTLETVLAARLLQGLGAAGPRVVSLAMVRDLYSGRHMARIMSFAMMIFTLVPALAPLAGQGIIALTGWRGIFLAFLVFAVVATSWLSLRQPETLAKAARRPLHPAVLLRAVAEVLANRQVVMAMVVQTLIFACLFGTISSTQQIFDVHFGRGAEFPLWFALIALCSGSASLINAALVVRLGMRFLVSVTLAVEALLTALYALTLIAGGLPEGLAFALFVIWAISVFMMAGLVLGNLNALAMEPMGHIAGMAASVTGSLATVASVMIAAPLGLAFDGTPRPLVIGVTALAAAGFVLMRWMPRRG